MSILCFLFAVGSGPGDSDNIGRVRDEARPARCVRSNLCTVPFFYRLSA